MSMNNRWLSRLGLALALAPLAITAVAGPAWADGHHRDWHRHDRDRYHDRGGYYAPPPPPVYYAPPQPRPSPGISLFFPIR